MTSISGFGERLALLAGGALVLALAQLLQANRKGKSTVDEDEGMRAQSIISREAEVRASAKRL